MLGVLARVVDENVDRFDDRRPVDADRWQPLIDRHDNPMVARDRFGARDPGADDLVERDGAQMRRLRRVRLAGMRQRFDETVQAVGLFVDDLEQLALPFHRQVRQAPPRAGADERGHRGLDRRQRRAQVVRQRVEQRRLELLVAPRRLGFAGAIEGDLQLLIEPLDFLTAGLRFGGAPLGARRQFARHHGGDDEGHELDPVHRILDGEAFGREKVVGVAGGGQRRGNQRRAHSPESRRDDDVEEQQRRGDAGTVHGHRAQQRDEGEHRAAGDEEVAPAHRCDYRSASTSPE